jgi:DNA helicase-2/ATP-dependent DNA helicase PcrA
LPHPIVEEEQVQLDRVSRLLAEVPFEVPPSEADTVAELVRLRDEFAAAKEEDKPAIMQQYDHNLALLQQLRDARDKPVVDPASPYFAHLTLTENGKTRDLFLGKATRIDHGLRIVDWRNAPVSRIFYSYQQGEEYEEQFGARTLVGTVDARRTVTIEGGTLHRIDAPEGVFQREDDAWAEQPRQPARLAGGQGASVTRLTDTPSDRRLGSDARGKQVRRDKRLPDIAGLIDPDQFDLITRPASGFLVVRGTAGSGKTTVALHRIAYLAYDDDQINSGRTLFLVFSKALRDYVSNVLPSLGIGRVRPKTFPEWAEQQRRSHFKHLPKKYRDDTPEVVVRLKSHPATMVAIERQREAVDGAANVEQAIDDWASVLTQEHILRPVLEELAPDAFTDAEIRKAVEWCRDRNDEIVAWMEGDRESPALLDREDDPLLLWAHQCRVGPLRFRGRRPLTYRHVAVDEVQDFSPVEVRVLLGVLDKRKSITLAGDTQQHVMANAGFTNWTEFFGWLGVKGTSVDTLRVAYRSSRQIVTFALRLLGPLSEDDPPLTVREGPPVELFRFTDHGACVAFLADALKALARDEPFASVALVVPNSGIASMYYQGLSASEVPRLRRVVDEEFSFTPGIELVEVRDVKGLEFDYVVIVEASHNAYPPTAEKRRLLHVAATRAIHQLWVTSVGSTSDIVKAALDGDT